jgi:hypothetical protein
MILKTLQVTDSKQIVPCGTIFPLIDKEIKAKQAGVSTDLVQI